MRKSPTTILTTGLVTLLSLSACNNKPIAKKVFPRETGECRMIKPQDLIPDFRPKALKVLKSNKGSSLYECWVPATGKKDNCRGKIVVVTQGGKRVIDLSVQFGK